MSTKAGQSANSSGCESHPKSRTIAKPNTGFRKCIKRSLAHQNGGHGGGNDYLPVAVAHGDKSAYSPSGNPVSFVRRQPRRVGRGPGSHVPPYWRFESINLANWSQRFETGFLTPFRCHSTPPLLSRNSPTICLPCYPWGALGCRRLSLTIVTTMSTLPNSLSGILKWTL